MKRTLLSAAILICTVACAAAQEGITATVHPIDKVTVYSSRPVKESALTVSVVDSVQMAETAYGTFADLLSRHTTLFVRSYGQGSLATVSFRGTAPNHTLVDWNGLNINGPMMGQVDFSQVPVWLVDKVELYHGGSSLRNGSGALGGNVAISSVPEWGQRFYGSAGAGLASYDTYNGFLSVGGGNSTVQARVRYYVESAQNDFKFVNQAIPPFEEQRQQGADYFKHGGGADLFWNAGRKNYLSLHLWYHDSDRNIPPGMLYEGAGRRENQHDTDKRVSLRWNKNWARASSEFTAGVTLMQLDYFLEFETGIDPFVSIDSYSAMQSWQASYKFNYILSARTQLQVKADARRDEADIEDHRTGEGYDAGRTRLGAHAAVLHDFGRGFSAFALLRGDLSDGKTLPLMPSVGLEYRPERLKGAAFKVNATRNYRQPTLNELHWQPGGNPDLKPEKGYTADIAAAYLAKHGRFTYDGSITAYASWIDDWILWRPAHDAAGPRNLRPENIRKVFARGLEILASVRYDLGKLNLRLGGNYALTKTTNERPESGDDASKGRQLVYIPVHKGNLMLAASYEGWYCFWVWSAVGERFTTSSNEATRHTLPAYDLHNATVGKNFKMGGTVLNAELKINNVFGRHYRAELWTPMPGRNYSLLVKVSF